MDEPLAGTDPLVVNFDRAGATLRVVVGGELDFDVAEAFFDLVASQAVDNGLQQVTLDLSRLTFMDCGGVAALVRLRLAVRANGCGFAIANPRPIVRRVLAVTGQLGLMRELAESLEETT
ncbi:STAS domain-containing protein [Asanoa sp. NPDC049518]|uniref:STAS domain-containing protein n=1 Tax=unclassified Asanoa TaxID=2685164 RepID=UPI0034262781